MLVIRVFGSEVLSKEFLVLAFCLQNQTRANFVTLAVIRTVNNILVQPSIGATL